MLIVYDQHFAGHLRGIAHPESPQRVEAIAQFLRARSDCTFIGARNASDAEIERVHEPGYVDLVRTEVAAVRGHTAYLSTGDTMVDEHSFAAARRAAGGAIVAVESAIDRQTACFAVVRPPGHHAEPATGMGFCIFNNAAIAARAAQAQHGLRTLIVDFDYHHGNGTQAAIGGGISYVSTHAYPAYPGTGSAAENAVLAGGDRIANVPLPPHGFGTEPFIALWERLLPEVARRVRPGLLIVSAGFDYVAGDPVGDLGVDVFAAGALAATVNATAQEYCDGRVAYVLEGGYDLHALQTSVGEIVAAHNAGKTESSGAAEEAIPVQQRSVLEALRALN